MNPPGRSNRKDFHEHHSHRGAETIIYTQGASATDSVAFTAPDDGLYSYLWANPGTVPAHLTIATDLPPGAELDSWVPPLRESEAELRAGGYGGGTPPI